MLASYLAVGLALTPINEELASHASNGNGYVITGAAMATIISLIGLPIWRLLHVQKKEREHNNEMLAHVVTGMYGKGEVREQGVLVEPAAEGVFDRLGKIEEQIRTGSPTLIAKLDEHNTTINARLAKNQRDIAEARKAAGDAAVVAARVEDRLQLVNDRMWDWVSDLQQWVSALQQRNEGLSAALHELGYDVASLPDQHNGERPTGLDSPVSREDQP